jgi:hypothetical protein
MNLFFDQLYKGYEKKKSVMKDDGSFSKNQVSV